MIYGKAFSSVLGTSRSLLNIRLKKVLEPDRPGPVQTMGICTSYLVKGGKPTDSALLPFAQGLNTINGFIS